MARKRAAATKKPARKKAEPELVYDEGYWWIVEGSKRTNVGRSKRYAENLMAEQK